MGWITFNDNRGETWEVNQEGVYLLLRASVRAHLIRQRTRVVEIDNGLLLPATYQVDTNWQGFRAEVDRDTATFYANAEQRTLMNAQDMFGNLVAMTASTRADFQAVDAMRQRANRQSSDNIAANVANWETALGIAQTVRDASATILVAGASVMSGGTALAVLGAGSALRGTATYQDSGNVGAALVQATGTFVVGAIGIAAAPAAASGAAGSNLTARIAQQTTIDRDAATVLVVSAGMAGAFQGIQSLTEGASATIALEQAGAAAGLNLVGGVLAAKMGNVPIGIRVTTNGIVDNRSNAAVGSLRPAAPRPPAPARGTIVVRPRVTGNADYANVPMTDGTDSNYVRDNCLRKIR